MCDRIERMICMKAIRERRRDMCEVSAYLIRDGKEELFMEGVAGINPMDDGRLCLKGLSGEQRYLTAKVLHISMLEHKIIMEKVNEPRNISNVHVHEEAESHI